MNAFESPLVSEDDLGKYARMAFQDAMASGVNVDMLMRHFRALMNEAHMQAQARIQRASRPSVNCAEAIREETIEREQRLFEQTVGDDGDLNTVEKTPDGRSYVHPATNTMWSGWICKALHSNQSLTPSAAGPALQDRQHYPFDSLCQLAIDCPHSIDSEKVVLYFDSKKPGNNALNQLSMRLKGFFGKA